MNMNVKVPWKPRVPMPLRREALDKLHAASQYAWIQMADPAMRAEYQHGCINTKKSAYALAVADFLNSPKIRSVNLELYKGYAADPITIYAVDDFRVAGVRVELLANDVTIEAGEAREQGNALWRYQTRHTVLPLERISLVITAYDIPGNIDNQTIQLQFT
jgi:hypothetical protein